MNGGDRIGGHAADFGKRVFWYLNTELRTSPQRHSKGVDARPLRSKGTRGSLEDRPSIMGFCGNYLRISGKTQDIEAIVAVAVWDRFVVEMIFMRPKPARGM